MNELKWYVVYTKPRWEKKVVNHLTKLGIEAYCPTTGFRANWFESKKSEGLPVFASYVFVCVKEDKIPVIENITGVVNFIYWHGQPAVISFEEIGTIKNITSAYSHIKLEKSIVKLNEQVDVINETQLFRKGDIVEVRNAAVRVNLPSLGYYLIAENTSGSMIEHSILNVNSKSISMTKPSF